MLHGTGSMVFIDDCGLSGELRRIHDAAGDGRACCELIVSRSRILPLILAGVCWIEVRHLSEARARCLQGKEGD